jgi:hypothetical protein
MKKGERLKGEKTKGKEAKWENGSLIAIMGSIR